MIRPTRCHSAPIALALALLAAAPTAGAEEPAEAPALDAPGGARAKIANPVRRVLDRSNARHRRSAIGPPPSPASLSTARVRVGASGSVQVYVHSSEPSGPALTRLRALGAEVEAIDARAGIVQVSVPLNRLESLAALPFVRRVTPPSYRRTRAGSVTTAGDAILRADRVRALGPDGTGVRVGVISDGHTGLAQAQATGDLPFGITTFGTCTPAPADPANCLGRDLCSEGTAIAEIIHDVAPGADIAIAAVGTSVEFAQRLDDLFNRFGADIVIDDLGFFAQPYFEHGSIALAVAGKLGDVLYVSSAGNDADRHHEAQYRRAFANGREVHDFGLAAGGGPEASMRLTIAPDENALVFLQWNDPFGASANDYDLWLMDSTGANVLCNTCTSRVIQDGFEPPLEAVCYHNDTAATVTGRLVVQRFDGAERRLELFVLGGATVAAHNLPAGSIFGHSGLADVLSVGAIDAADPGNDTVEFYSSRGPARIDFPGLRLEDKPDILAIDGVRVSGAGEFPQTFFGTSASAPHVAAVAALLKQKFPGVPNARLRELLRGQAVDLGAPGPDLTHGWGRADARSAYGAFVTAITLPATSLLLD